MGESGAGVSSGAERVRLRVVGGGMVVVAVTGVNGCWEGGAERLGYSSACWRARSRGVSGDGVAVWKARRWSAKVMPLSEKEEEEEEGGVVSS